jgi:hypothetical protein
MGRSTGVIGGRGLIDLKAYISRLCAGYENGDTYLRFMVFNQGTSI